MHVHADGLHGRSLPRVHPFGEQRAQTVFAPISPQPDHFAADQVGQDGPELLAFPALDFIHAQVSTAVLRPRPIPRLEKCPFGSARVPQLTTTGGATHSATSPDARPRQVLQRSCLGVAGELRRHLGDVFRQLAQLKESRIEEGHLLPDHVHMLIAIPPKYAVAQVMGFIKGKTALNERVS